eukprot:TRINITY_DN36011_c0_g1_i2.p1 TRINITY_DN36011_c0_g1~~TRINITY_DN36011_c0_g1_i2.p1  ORF type:complete len:421 (+),score=84.93 TRINITY_DN36011_c0_g1_i2:88-1350(+)
MYHRGFRDASAEGNARLAYSQKGIVDGANASLVGQNMAGIAGGRSMLAGLGMRAVVRQPAPAVLVGQDPSSPSSPSRPYARSNEGRHVRVQEATNAFSPSGQQQQPSAPRAPQELTTEILLDVCGGHSRSKNEAVAHFLARQTHLPLHGLRLGRALGKKLSEAAHVCVLYAYDNLLSSFDGIGQLRRLRQLYLQNNRFTQLKGIEALPNSLRKLHLGNNRLRRIDCLETLEGLEELHLPQQQLPFDVPLQFCPTSIAAIAPTLRVLDVSACGLTDAAVLAPLQNLQTLDLSDNFLEQVDDARGVLSGCCLTRVKLAGNPAVQDRRYRSAVVLLARVIEEIDGKTVLPVERDFVRRLEGQRRRLARQARQDSQQPAMFQRSDKQSRAGKQLAVGDGNKAGLQEQVFTSMLSPPILQDLVST